MQRPAFVRVPRNRPQEDYPSFASVGSPSEGELHRGDIITRIENHETSTMTHQSARNAIKNTGNTLNLTVLRSGQSVSNSYHQPVTHHTFNVPSLPRTEFNHYQHERFAPPPAHNSPAAVNAAEDGIEKQIEIHSIVSQPHRTFPLITPSIKVKHDLPTGCYLRHVSDPFAKNREASMKSKVQESVLNAGVAYSSGSSPARSGTPDVVGTIGSHSNIVHRQYNSPINMYSHQSMLETIAGQTGATPGPKKLEIRFFDITKSPTYQAVYETEWKTLRKRDLAEHRPIAHQVKILPTPTTTVNTTCEWVNPLGVPKDKILQSKSFDMIRNSLTGQSDF